MSTPIDLAPTIGTEATLPVESHADNQGATGRPIAELIAADQYLANKAAATQRRRGILFSKLTTPGALSDCGHIIGYGPGWPW